MELIQNQTQHDHNIDSDDDHGSNFKNRKKEKDFNKDKHSHHNTPGDGNVMHDAPVQPSPTFTVRMLHKLKDCLAKKQ